MQVCEYQAHVPQEGEREERSVSVRVDTRVASLGVERSLSSLACVLPVWLRLGEQELASLDGYWDEASS